MLEALHAAESKLREYYSQTIDLALGSIYAHGTILAPQYKLQFFQSKEWEDEIIDYTEVYRLDFRTGPKAQSPTWAQPLNGLGFGPSPRARRWAMGLR